MSKAPERDSPASSIDEDVIALIGYLLRRPGVGAATRLDDAHRVLSKHRSERLDDVIAALGDDRVRRGPFEGMRFPCGWCDPCYTPKLLGVYERELQAIVLGFATRGYRTVINAGCAEGYYAVGLARALPRVEVLAFDSEPRARERCAELAALNQVSDRVTIGGTVRPEALAGHPLPALLVCDVEGAENELLDPLKAPALVDMDILVEVHDVFVEGTTERLTARFGDSHRITPVASGSVDLPALPELDGMEQMDRLLAYWEGRLAGTHWLWMSVG